jgi:superfamily II DNA or RNA helicase
MPSGALGGLSTAEIQLAELKALVGEGMTKGAFFDVVRGVGIPGPDGKAWTAQRVGEVVHRLIAKRILASDGHIGTEWRGPLTSRVALRPDGADLARRVREASPKSWRESPAYTYYHGRRQWPYFDADMARAARLMAVAGDEAQVESLIDKAESEAREDGCAQSMAPVLLRHTPLDPAFLSALSPALRDRLTSAAVEGLLEQGWLDDDVEAVIEAAGEPDIDWSLAPRLDQAMMRLDILAERPERARERIARLRASAAGPAPPGSSGRPAAGARKLGSRGFGRSAATAPEPGVIQGQTAQVMGLAGQGALAFLTGPAAGALPLFRDALKQHRKLVGKRKVVLPGEFALFHVLALLAAGEATLHAEIAGLLEGLDGTAPHVRAALTCLLALAAGQDLEAKTAAERLAPVDDEARVSRDPFGLAVTTLALGVVSGANAQRRAPFDAKAMEAWEDQAPLATRILAEVHVRFPDPAHVRPDWAAKLKRLGDGYPRRFLDIVPIRPAWERTLDKLQGFLAPRAEPGAKAAPVSAAKRMIFRLDAATGDITALEQAARAGGWSAGRPVALKRLHQRDPKLDYLTAEDQRVAGTVKFYRNYYEEIYDFDPLRGPLALVGHPRLFDAQAPEQRVDLALYPAELVVRETKKTLRIDLSHRAERPAVVIEPEAPDRWRLIEVTQALVDLAAVLGPEGLEVPREARDRVVALIKTENPRLPVRSELAGVATESLKGDPRPVLRIAPEDGGFHIRAVVRPIGEAGPAYPPGQGSRSVLVAEGGAHRRLERDLAAEAAALEAVAEACPALAPWRDSDLDWRIEGLDGVLEALQELHDCPAPVGLEWPQGAALKPTRTVGAKAMSLNIASGKDWFEVKGEIEVDEGLVLDMAQVLARLGRNPGRFVALDDGRYLALTEDLRRRLDALAAMTETTRGGQRIGAVGAAALEDLIDGVGKVKADRRWAAMIERLGAARGYEPQVPDGLQAELRDYQRQGFAWLARLSRLGLGACLADDMGLGKTVQTLALLLNDAAKGPSLVVAPTSVCHNWVLEAAKFAPSLRVMTLAGAPDRKAVVEGLAPGDVLVASYGLLHTEADLLASRRFAVAVFDEAQNLKNAETRRAQASKRIDAEFRLALSGTPLENRLDELWSLFDTVTPGLLGSREAFQRRFSGPIEKGHGAHARQALKTLLRPYLLRRTKGAVLTELPSRTEIALEVEPGPAERAFYEALRRKALENLAQIAETGGQGGGAKGAGGQKRIRILAEITRLRRAACNPALIEPGIDVGSAKLDALLELVDELRAGRHRALVFSQFTGHLDLVEAALKAKGVALLRLDGSTPAKERARLVEAFQAGEGEIFLISLKAGGSGLNLTGADYVIHLDPWWNPAVEDQATDRAHRIGQTRPVTVYRLVVKDSIEQPILALHAAKRTLAADFLEDADAAGPLGEDELMALIRG